MRSVFKVGFVFLVDFEVRVLLEGRVQREHHVQRLHQRVRQTLINRNIQNVARHLAVVRQRKIDLFTRCGQPTQQFLYLRRPLFHQGVDVRHRLRVAD